MRSLLLLELPPELRCRIWAMVFEGNLRQNDRITLGLPVSQLERFGRKRVKSTSAKRHRLAITEVSQQIRKESLYTLFFGATLVLDTILRITSSSDYEPSRQDQDLILRAFAPLLKLKPFADHVVQFHLISPFDGEWIDWWGDFHFRLESWKAAFPRLNSPIKVELYNVFGEILDEHIQRHLVSGATSPVTDNADAGLIIPLENEAAAHLAADTCVERMKKRWTEVLDSCPADILAFRECNAACHAAYKGFVEIMELIREGIHLDIDEPGACWLD